MEDEDLGPSLLTAEGRSSLTPQHVKQLKGFVCVYCRAAPCGLTLITAPERRLWQTRLKLQRTEKLLPQVLYVWYKPVLAKS